MGAILVEGPNRRTHFWKRIIQWLFHQHLVLIEQMVSDKIFMRISHRVLCEIKFGCGGHLGWKSEMPDTILEGDHPRILSAKFGWDWFSSFRGEDFFKFLSPLFSNFSLVAILVGSWYHRTQFWKGITQESFQQSLVEIGSVVSEENFFFKLHPPFFYF